MTTIPQKSASTINSSPTIQSKLHITPAIVAALKFLDKHQNNLSKKSQKLAETVLNVIDAFPGPFLQDEESDNEHPEPLCENTQCPEDGGKTLVQFKPKTSSIPFFLRDEANSDTCHGFITYDSLQTLSKLLRELKYPPKQCFVHRLIHCGSVCSHEQRKSSYVCSYSG